MARVNTESLSFTCHPHVYPLVNELPLLPSRWYSFPILLRVGGWVGPRGLVKYWGSLPVQRRSPVWVLTGPDVEYVRWSAQRRYHYAKPPPNIGRHPGGANMHKFNRIRQVTPMCPHGHNLANTIELLRRCGLVSNYFDHLFVELIEVIIVVVGSTLYPYWLSCFRLYIVDASCRQLKSALQCWVLVAVSCNIHIDVMLSCPMTLTSQPSMSFCLALQLTASTPSCTQVHSPRSVSRPEVCITARGLYHGPRSVISRPEVCIMGAARGLYHGPRSVSWPKVCDIMARG